ncbi:hypothetical protein D3C73_1462360 [compost metagenome]
MAANEPRRVDSLLQRTDGVAHEIGCAAGVQLDVVALGEDVIDLVQRLPMQAVGASNPDLALVQRRLVGLLQGGDEHLQLREALV